MWAQVKDGSVEKIIAHPKSMVDENGVQHPRSIFSMWTKEEKIAIGIYDVIMAPTYDDKYYISHNPTYAVVGDNVVQSIEKAGDHELEDKHATDEESKKMFDLDGKPIINFGLKSKAIDTVKSQQASMLSQTDWAIIRKSDNGTEIPDNIQTYRDAVRVKAEEMEEAITKATTMEAFKKLSITTHTKAGKVKDLAILQDWPQLGE
tara:strand:+ start:564 stop:1178 length:615 start_codon:yes stop_codon:yes gene_type:complete